MTSKPVHFLVADMVINMVCFSTKLSIRIAEFYLRNEDTIHSIITNSKCQLMEKNQTSPTPTLKPLETSPNS